MKKTAKGLKKVRIGFFSFFLKKIPLLNFSKDASYKRSLRNLSLAILVVAATLVSLFTFVIFQRISKATSLASTGLRGEALNFDSRVSIILGEVEDFSNPTSLIVNLLILTVEFSERKAAILKVPVDLAVPNLADFGQNKLQGLFGLINLTQKKDYSLLNSEVQRVLSLPIDGFILTDRVGRDRLEEALGPDLGLERLKIGDVLFFLRQARLLPGLFSHIRTDVALGNLFYFFNKALQTRFNKFELSDLDIASPNDYSASFLDSRIEEEGKSIIVLNGTKTPLLAFSAGRLISNIGGRVLEATNAPGDAYPQNIIITNSKDSYTVGRLSEIFDVTGLRSLESMEEDPRLLTFLRADVVLILGQENNSPR